MVISSNSLTSPRIWNMPAISMRWLANPNQGCTRFSHNFGAHKNDLFIIKVKILVLVKWWHWSLPTTLTIEPRIINIIWACKPIPFKHVSFWYLFMEAHLTTYHSNTFVIITYNMWLNKVCLPYWLNWMSRLVYVALIPKTHMILSSLNISEG